MSIPSQIFAVCVQAGDTKDTIEVRKIGLSPKNGPFFALAKEDWPLHLHEHVRKTINVAKLKRGGFRTVIVKLMNRGVPSEAASKYVTSDGKLKFNEKLLVEDKDNQLNENDKLDLTKDISAFEIFSKFGNLI